MAVSAAEFKEAQCYLVEIMDDYGHPLHNRQHPQHRACRRAFRQLKSLVEAETYFLHKNTEPLIRH